MSLVYSEACERNKHAILDVIRPLLGNSSSLLEIGSGTGQHATFFAAELPHLIWTATDQLQYLPNLQVRFQQELRKNLIGPLELDVNQWPSFNGKFDVVFTANTLHIMNWLSVEKFFNGLSLVISKNAQLIIYGPFKYNGEYTSASNAKFDQWLKNQDPQSGIRDMESLVELAERAKLTLKVDYNMPANNQCLVFGR